MPIPNHNGASIRCLQAPRTFQMEKLLSELKQIDNTSLSTAAADQVALNQNSFLNTNASNDWSQEYWSSMLVKQPSASIDEKSFKWSTDYLTQTEATIFDEAWGNLVIKNSSKSANHFSSMLPNSDFNNVAGTTNNQLNEEMRKTANELLDSMQDSRFSETEVCFN